MTARNATDAAAPRRHGRRGWWIVIEASIHASAFAHAVASALTARWASESLVTKLPSATPLGRLVREFDDRLVGRSLALVAAADRSELVSTEITPALWNGAHVVSVHGAGLCLTTGLVDGLDIADTWAYHAHLAAPDLTVWLDIPAALLPHQRTGYSVASPSGDFGIRARVSRIHVECDPEREASYTRAAFGFLADQGWRQTWIDCGSSSLETVVHNVTTCLSTRDRTPASAPQPRGNK